MERTTENMAAVEQGSDLQDTTSASPIDPNDVAGGSCAQSIIGGAIGGLGGGVIGAIIGGAGGAIAGCSGPGMFSTGTGNIGNDVIAA